MQTNSAFRRAFPTEKSRLSLQRVTVGMLGEATRPSNLAHLSRGGVGTVRTFFVRLQVRQVNFERMFLSEAAEEDFHERARQAWHIRHGFATAKPQLRKRAKVRGVRGGPVEDGELQLMLLHVPPDTDASTHHTGRDPSLKVGQHAMLRLQGSIHRVVRPVQPHPKVKNQIERHNFLPFRGRRPRRGPFHGFRVAHVRRLVRSAAIAAFGAVSVLCVHLRRRVRLSIPLLIGLHGGVKLGGGVLDAKRRVGEKVTAEYRV